MPKQTKDLGTPTVRVRYIATTPAEKAAKRRELEQVLSEISSRQLGFPVSATLEMGTPPAHYGKTRICHGEEIVYPDLIDKELLPDWAIDAINTFGNDCGARRNFPAAEGVI